VRQSGDRRILFLKKESSALSLSLVVSLSRCLSIVFWGESEETQKRFRVFVRYLLPPPLPRGAPVCRLKDMVERWLWLRRVVVGGCSRRSEEREREKNKSEEE
jgi:hypothetical protein